MVDDVVVVGAGPAGLMSAYRLARSGVKVKLLERHPNENVSLMGELVTQKVLRFLEINKHAEQVANQFKQIKAVNLDTGTEITVDRTMLNESFLLDEDAVQTLLKEKAESYGAEFLFRKNVRSVIKENGYVVGVKTRDEKYRSKIVVGADGSYSRIARTAGIPLGKYATSYGFRLKLSNVKVDPDIAYFYVGRDIGVGYLWMYPRSETEVNLGIGRVPMTKSYLSKLPTQNEVVRKYMKTTPGFENAKITNRNGGIVPLFGLIPRFVDSGVVLAGNAAGQVSAMVGGGVATSLHAGIVLSRALVGALEDGDYSRKRLMEYEKTYRKTPEAHSIQNTGKGMDAVLEFARVYDVYDIVDDVLGNIDARSINEIIQGHHSIGTIIGLALEQYKLIGRIFKMYIRALALTSFS